MEDNNYQIIRKDAKNCFVESLNDAFKIGKIHLNFATYDLSRPSGKGKLITLRFIYRWTSFWSFIENLFADN